MSVNQSAQEQEYSIPVVHIGGSVSPGKSSFTNALLGMMVNHVSKPKNTFSPMKYQLRKKPTIVNDYYLKRLDTLRLSDEKDFENFKKVKVTNDSKMLNELETKINTIIYEERKYIEYSFDIDIVNFPGFNDDAGIVNKKDIFLESYVNNLISCDIAIYVIDCNSSFLRRDDMEALKKIQERIKFNHDEKNKYCELFIVASKYASTKYDYQSGKVNNMWKAIDKTIKINKENIFFIGTHQLFVHNCSELVYLPKSCEDELKSIFNLFNDRSKKMKCEFDQLTLKKNFIDEKYWNVEKNGDWNDLMLKLKSFGVGLQIRRIQPKYDSLMNWWNKCVNNSWGFYLYASKESVVGKNVLKSGQHLYSHDKKKNTSVFSSNNSKRKKQINVFKNKYSDSYLEEGQDTKNLENNSIDDKFYTNEFPTEEEARYTKALISIIYRIKYEYPSLNVPLSPLRFEDYIKVYNNPSSLDKFNKKIYEGIKNKVLELKDTKFYDEFFRDIFRPGQNIVERLLVIYISSKFGKYYSSVGCYVWLSPNINIEYQALLLGNFLERSKTFPVDERKRLMNQFNKYEIMSYFKISCKYETPLFDISQFDFEYYLPINSSKLFSHAIFEEKEKRLCNKRDDINKK